MPPKKMRLSKGALTKKGTKAKEGEAAPPAQDSSSEDSDFEEQEGGTRIAGVYIPPAPAAVCSVESIGPRLIITHIVNLNFKSYAGRQVLGPFHKSFTCVIGPNGSGKSNVIDSMLFVFGYRATKIRSKKISVLLHKSENHRDIKHATVEVHFAKIIDIDDEKYELVPNSEFYVSRTANYDNSSHYTINGKRAQFKDVSNLLGSHGIDLKHNRFLILQGEVEQIAMMKPKGPSEHESGMLEYLEDIIGTSRYKRPIEKLEVKVNDLTEERQEKLNRVKLAEKDKEALQAPMEEAIEYLKLTNKKARTDNKILQLQSHKATTKLNTLKEEKEKKDKEIADKKEKLKEAQDKIEVKEKSASGIKKEYDGLKAKKEKLTESFNKVEKRATQLKEEITQTNKKRKKAMESKAQEEKKLSDLEKIPEKNTKEIGELNTLQEKLKKEQEVEEQEVQKVLENLKVETKGFQEQKDQLENTLIGLNRDRDNAKSKYELAKTELTVYLSNEKKEKDKLAKLKSTLENITKNLEDKQKVLEELRETLPQKEHTLAEKQKELADLKIEESRVMSELNQQRAVMEEKKHTLSASASRNRVIDFLMKEKEKGAIPGIFGRLGDLGGIDAKYDCAVSTACGPLDYVVVDNSSTAKACINALKRSGVGRGNFIALDQQNKFIPNCQQRFNGPEGVPRLFDLIKVEDERVKPAFYFGLRDTLVADDLSQARRVAYGATRYRVVTLNGEIIEIAGTMSGGGRDKRTGRMGRSATVKTDVGSPGAMGRLEERVRQLQERASSIHQKMNQLEPEIFNLTKDLRKLKMDLTSLQMEVKNLSQQVPSLTNQVTSQEGVVARTVSDPKVVQEKTDMANKLKEEFDTAAAESGEIEKKVAELTDKITAITGGRMKAAQQKLEKVSKQLDKVCAEITKLTVAIKTSERNCKKSKDRIQALANEITEAEENLIKAQEENKSLEEEAVKVNQFIEDVANKLIELEASMTSEKTETNNLNKVVNALKAELMNSNQGGTELGKKVSELEAALAGLRKKISSLKLQVIPDEEEADYSLPVYTEEELNNFDGKKLDYESTKLHEMLINMNPNLKTIEDYREKVKILKERMSEYKDVQDRRNETRKGLDDVRKARLNEFMVGFNIISNKLKEMYQMITFGGDAEFELVDTLDPFTEGISFSVRPPKKSWKNISNLSGGEKTLSSLALVFALHYYKPSPLFFMDEIDAALDFKNVSIVGHYIKERTKNAQFIIISLRSNMFELADVLVGIYKTYNCTKSITVSPGLYVKTDENGVEKQYRTVVISHSDQPLSRKSPPRKTTQSKDSGKTPPKRGHSPESGSPPRKAPFNRRPGKSSSKASTSSASPPEGETSVSTLSSPGMSSRSTEGSISPPQKSPPKKQHTKDSSRSPPRKRSK